MGTFCTSNKLFSQSENYGQQITEKFQLTDSLLKQRKIDLTPQDKFFREAFYPMNLMNFKRFNTLITQFVRWDKNQNHTYYADNGWEFDPELIPVKNMLHYFKHNKNNLPQLAQKESIMYKVLKFDDVFVVKKTMQPMNNKNTLLIKEILCEVLDPKITEQMTEDEKRNHIEHSIEASLQLFEQSNKQQHNDQQEVDCIDIFTLRILSLLVCRGLPDEKAAFLANLTNGKDQTISWDNTDLTRALQLSLYISSILPLKFMSQNYDKPTYHKIMKSSQFSDKNTNFPHLFYKQIPLPKDKLANIQENRENLFCQTFTIFFQQQYIEKIFTNVETIPVSRFIDSFKIPSEQIPMYDQSRRRNCETQLHWFFSPLQVNTVLTDYMGRLNFSESNENINIKAIKDSISEVEEMSYLETKQATMETEFITYQTEQNDGYRISNLSSKFMCQDSAEEVNPFMIQG